MPISKMSANVSSGTQLKGLKLLAAPGMFLVQKYTQYRRHQQECAKKRATERELQSLTHKIVSYFFIYMYVQIRYEVRDIPGSRYFRYV